MSDSATETRTFTPGWSPTFRDFWIYRGLLKNLVLRDVKVKYQRSVLGFVWTLLNPLFTVLVLWLVFGHVMRIDMQRYWAFLVSGYFVWNCISQSLNASTRVLDEHSSLSRNVVFPNGILVLSTLLSKATEFLIELALVVVVLALAHHRGLPLSFALLPVVILLQLLITAGLMYPLAVASVFFRDVQHALPILITTLFYVTPVFYPASMIPDQVRGLFLLNPLAWLMIVYQSILYDGRLPEACAAARTGGDGGGALLARLPDLQALPACLHRNRVSRPSSAAASPSASTSTRTGPRRCENGSCKRCCGGPSSGRAPNFRIHGFDVRVAEGEAVALIGPNGAGKSSILRLMAGIYLPSEGFIRTVGRVAPVIELGSGFHAELSGLENIRLYGAIMGLAGRVSRIEDGRHRGLRRDRRVPRYTGQVLLLGNAGAARIRRCLPLRSGHPVARRDHVSRGPGVPGTMSRNPERVPSARRNSRPRLS